MLKWAKITRQIEPGKLASISFYPKSAEKGPVFPLRFDAFPEAFEALFSDQAHSLRHPKKYVCTISCQAVACPVFLFLVYREKGELGVACARENMGFWLNLRTLQIAFLMIGRTKGSLARSDQLGQSHVPYMHKDEEPINQGETRKAQAAKAQEDK